MNNNNENDKKDEVLVPLDHERNGFIRDDTLYTLLVKELKQRNVSMVARSIFLQGMLLNDDPKYRSIFGKKSVIFDEWFLYCKNNYIEYFKFHAELFIHN